ncbi:MAG: hypothetical protein OXR68_05070 [Alphaproteobacteria bacterium]|nr:hypothetical protein [Alphaproteobacteria bacterium]MDD9919974.1 hypothetical protein [Alphaproteobacteria bacterium]
MKKFLTLGFIFIREKASPFWLTVYLLLGYFFGAIFTVEIHMYPFETQWLSSECFIWVFAWPVMLILTIVQAIAFVIAAFLAVFIALIAFDMVWERVKGKPFVRFSKQDNDEGIQIKTVN